jgi:hypothetical protein
MNGTVQRRAGTQVGLPGVTHNTVTLVQPSETSEEER